MKMYHSTPKENIKSIREKGLIPNGMGIVYLSPTLKKVYRGKDRVILEIETGNNRLSAFEDCKEWEVFCWGKIPPEKIKIVRDERENKP